MTNRYSLADYIVTIKLPDNLPSEYSTLINKEIKIGGPGESQGSIGSFLGEITISRKEDQWSTASDHTGSWVHSQNLSKVGTVDLKIRQVSDDVIKLIQLCEIYNNTTIRAGLNITVTPANNSTYTNYAECLDCYPTRIPNQTFGASASEQTWTFTCGAINYKVESDTSKW